jgi:hypothetical protein
MKKVMLLIAAVSAMGLLAACASTDNSTPGTAPAMHQDVKGEQSQDTKGENTNN